MKSDAQLLEDITAELTWDPAIRAAVIAVEVNDGTVTLAGRVNSYMERWRAERAAQRVLGVRGLTVAIDVKLPGSSTRSDTDLTAAAQNALEWTTYLPRDSLQVKAENGWLTLSGEVDWDYQREIAKSAVRNLLGVVGVSNTITIRQQATAGVSRRIDNSSLSY